MHFSKPPKNFVAKPFAYHECVTLRIDTLTNLGLGLGRIDNWVVMVPFALPGEYVKARIYKNHANYSEADLEEVLEPSPHRTQAPCPLFGTCGGCQYQNLNYEEQLRWKTFHVKEQLERRLQQTVDVASTWPSPATYHYRSKITPHFPKTGDNSFPIGFLRQGTRHTIVDVPLCPIATEAINQVLPLERERLRTRFHKRGGTLLLRETELGVVTDPQALALAHVDGKRFHFRAGEFFQNNPFILPHFLRYAIQQAKTDVTHYLVDVYCGVGAFSIFGQERFKEVLGIEINEDAIELARENATLNDAQNCHFIAGSAEHLFSSVKFPPQETSVILDPPRKGCDKLFLEQLVAFLPRRIVYVSCAPDTQARDLTYLTGNYAIESVQPFDLFPQTRHIESVVTLTQL